MTRVLILGESSPFNLSNKLLNDEDNYIICLSDVSTCTNINNNRFVYRQRDLSKLTPDQVSSNLDYIYCVNNIYNITSQSIATSTGARLIYVTDPSAQIHHLTPLCSA